MGVKTGAGQGKGTPGEVQSPGAKFQIHTPQRVCESHSVAGGRVSTNTCPHPVGCAPLRPIVQGSMVPGEPLWRWVLWWGWYALWSAVLVGRHSERNCWRGWGLLS